MLLSEFHHPPIELYSLDLALSKDDVLLLFSSFAAFLPDTLVLWPP